MSKRLTLLVLCMAFIVSNAWSQNVIQVGEASYAEYPIPAVDNVDFYGMSWAYLRDGYPFSLHPDVQDQPVPTNDWWTDMFEQTYGGECWAYPHAVSTDNLGLNIIFPNAYAGNGMSDAIQLELKGSAPGGNSITFAPAGASPKRWGDIDLEFRMEQSASQYMDVTMAHGIPYVWSEFTGVEPVLDPNGTATIYNTSGATVTAFPATMSTFVMAIDGKYFGIHAAAGTVVSNNGGIYYLNTPNGSNYVVISMLPAQSFINTYDADARNMITTTTFNYNYNVSGGNISTTFDISTQNLDNGATGGNTIMSFMPHHWRETTAEFSLIPGADYTIYTGQMHSASGKLFTLNYSFGGMLPSMPGPITLTQTQQDGLYDMITDVSIAWAFAGDTYNKGLDEVSELMMVAHEIEHPRFNEFKESVKSTLNSWLTFDPAVDVNDWSQFFAFYPDYGGLIGFRPGYGSQGFNDLHFHYGYYVLAGARLCMVDDEFKAGYEGMLRLLAKTYANHTRYGVDGETDFYPWLRTFDPYVGHSWAGGMSSPDGNNQESLSEAVMSWFAIYNLGVALGDQELIELGAMGWTLETRAGKEYWFDVTGENFPPAYGHEYAGIFQASTIAHATYFSGDPGWVMGIHCVPSAHYMTHFGDNPAGMQAAFDDMIQERVNTGQIGTTDYYANINDMGPYLGGFLLGQMAQWDPEGAAIIVDQLIAAGWHMDGGTAPSRYGVISTNTTYTAATYGQPAAGYSTSLPTGAVYEAPDGTIITVIQNWTDQNQDVNVYNNGTLVETITVKAGKTYNSLDPGPFAPSVSFSEPINGTQVSTGETIILSAYANDKDGNVTSVEFFVNGTSIGTDVTAPYELLYITTTAGTLNFTAIATDDEGRTTTSDAVTTQVIDNLQTPYTGTAFAIPGTITAWQYDNGGQGVAYNDHNSINEGTNITGANPPRQDEGVDIEDATPPNIGWTGGGEWVEYTVDVATAGVYQVVVEKAGNGGDIRLELDRADVTGSVSIEATGDWAIYNTQTFTANLTQGTHILRLFFETGGINIRTFDFSLSGSNIPPTAVAGEDQTITLPVNSAVLGGSGNDIDGSIASYSWAQTNGPSTATMSAPNSASNTVSDLVAGTYVFVLTVTDNEGAIGTDQVSVIVQPEPINQAPVANAGANQTITLPTSAVTLNGAASSDPDGDPITFAWAQVSGPSTVTISGATGATATASNLVEGTYVFELTVDDGDLSGSDQVSIVVSSESNVPPIADAGANLNITLPANSVSLDGTASYDPDSDPITYAWTQVSGPSAATISGATSATATASGLIEGSYVFELSVNDGEFSATDQVSVTVNGCIPGNIALGQPATSSSVEGAYIATNAVDGNLGTRSSTAFSVPQWLKVDLGSSNSIDAVTLIWERASAESYYIMVSDIDSDPNPASVDWTIISTQTGMADAARTDNLTGLSGSGRYIAMYATNKLHPWGISLYEFEVYPSCGGSVNNAPNAIAGADQTITLPVNSVILDGTESSDPDGDDLTYAWSQVSGPSAATISNAANATTTASNLIVGTYLFELSVNDGDLDDSDQIEITVLGEPIAPVADAGLNQTIELPANSVSLDGTGSSDANGDPLTYAWSQVSGPSTATIIGASSATATANNLIEGTYVFGLSVSDGSLSDVDQVSITVNPQPNVAPVADAGADQIIQLPTNCVTLSGSGFDDNGDALTYLWTQISGPAVATINGATNASATACGLVEGAYAFELTVTDGALTDSDQTIVTVLGETVGCIVSATNGDFEVEVTNDGDNPSLTFIPGYTGVGDNIVILYYKVGNVGVFPGYIVQPNVPYQINASAGDHVYLYYTYSIPEGGERNSAANKNDFIVGQCGSTLKESIINSTTSLADVQVYPNPVTDILNIDLGENQYAKLSIFNTSGSEMLNKEIETDQDKVEVNISDFAKGTYILKLEGDMNISVHLIIKE